MALRDDYNPQKATLSIRLRDEELQTIKKAAKTAKKTIAQYVRETMLRKSNGILRNEASSA